jgi:hypothetical protein
LHLSPVKNSVKLSENWDGSETKPVKFHFGGDRLGASLPQAMVCILSLPILKPETDHAMFPSVPEGQVSPWW